MSASPSPDPASIVATLRAAGCVFAEDEARLLTSEARTASELAEMVRQRVAGLPIEQVVGWAAFRGLRIAVAPGVFVPRQRSEFLVRCAVELLGDADAGSGQRADGPALVVDVCCGSGAVGCAVAAATGAELHAADIDAQAVACARVNLAAVGGRVYQGDLFDPLPREILGKVGVIVVNAPYVPSKAIATLPAEARLHEPLVALDGGGDGLDVQRRVIGGACVWLASHGRLLVETSRRQAPATARLFAEAGLLPRVLRCDDLDATVVVGAKSAAAT